MNSSIIHLLRRSFNVLGLCSAFAFLALTGVAQPSTAPKPASDTVNHRIQTKSAFRIKSSDWINIDLPTSVDVILTGSKGNQVEVGIDVSGAYLKAEARQENGTVIIRTWFEMPESMSSSSGVIQISLPKKANVRLNAGASQVSIQNVEANIIAELGMGSIQAQNSTLEGMLSTRSGYINVSAGTLQGGAHSGQGGILITGLKGKFDCSGPQGDFSIESDSEVDAKLENDSLRVQAKQGKLRARSFRGKAHVLWQGASTGKGNSMDVSATEGDLTVSVPDGLGADLEIEQLSSNGSEPAVIDSDYSLVSPSEEMEKKEITHQGKKQRLVRKKQTLSSGGNSIVIRGYDSKIHLKKK